jgi:hypothetical protein
MKVEIFWILFGSLVFWSVFVHPSIISFQKSKTQNYESKEETELFTRHSVFFQTKELSRQLHSWFYVPKKKTTLNRDGKAIPMIIMANGLGLQKDFNIPKYAEKFLEMGIAVFSFDYQTFGGSDGYERNIVNIQEQISDWEITLDFIFLKRILYRVKANIDFSRIVLWGNSLSGKLK